MTSLLHVDSSHSGDSVSKRLTALFADVWRARNGTAGYTYRDVFAEPVPMVSPAYVALGTRVERHGVVPLEKVHALVEGADEEREWALTLPLIKELRSADTLLVGAPMYNYSVTTALKAWIDRFSFPGAFADPDTGAKLLRGTRVVIVTARGGAYGPGAPREGLDFQEPYLRGYFGNLGVEDLRFVHAEFTRAADIPALHAFQDDREASLTAAREAVTELAAYAVTSPACVTTRSTKP
ncbi:FMN-dependent NADH-azoreductase [Actinomadura roseirufa]|uniref:FMN-dependent NADH-azoreductase n=1 Tax=Actinomadura roseirufa TaxID=2094049 RepID=UPI00104140AA|nr:NAD(P)H-dependent oxidoreductase [Actinomadura roseirufa]